MRKKTVLSAAAWLCMLGLLAVSAFLYDSATAFTLTLLVGVFPFVSFGICAKQKKRLRCTLVMPAAAEKNTQFTGGFVVANASRIFPGVVTADITAKNLYTGERVSVTLRVSPLPRGERQTRFALISPHCGCFSVQTLRVRLSDWTGVFPMKLPPAQTAVCAVLPQTFPVALTGLPGGVPEADAERYSQTKPGNDPTEIFELREYVPGDDLRRLHRKLSEKLDRPVVRLDALPLENSVLLLCDASVAGASPALRDAVAESMTSVGLALRREDVRFCFAWSNEQGFFSVNAATQQAAADAVTALLGAPGSPADALTPSELFARERFGRVVVFSAGDPLSPPECEAQILRFSDTGSLSPQTYTSQLSVLQL